MINKINKNNFFQAIWLCSFLGATGAHHFLLKNKNKARLLLISSISSVILCFVYLYADLNYSYRISFFEVAIIIIVLSIFLSNFIDLINISKAEIGGKNNEDRKIDKGFAVFGAWTAFFVTSGIVFFIFYVVLTVINVLLILN